MSLKKRIKIFSSFSKIKTLFIVLSYLLCAVVIAIVARVVRKFHPCCCRPGSEGQIIVDHGSTLCCGFCKVSGEVNTIDKTTNKPINTTNNKK